MAQVIRGSGALIDFQPGRRAQLICLGVQATSLEAIGRDQYTSTEDRDPEGCSIYYLALRKKRLIQGLWKQAYGHKDRNNMIKFLSNDFDQPRWKTAARKNAFALMGKQRFGKV